MTHHRNECEHGTIMGQCRCAGIYGVKEKRIVPCNSRCPQFPPCEPAPTVELQGDSESEKVFAEDCDGSDSCHAAFHYHGCYADDGNCNMLDEHRKQPVIYTSDEFANMASERYDAGFEAGRKFGLQQAIKVISDGVPSLSEEASP